MALAHVGQAFRQSWDGHFGPMPRPDRWVFIVGCYNSGTTLLHDLMATHCDVGSMPWEGQFYTDQFPLPMALKLPRLWAIEPQRFCLSESDGDGIQVERLKRQWGARYNDPSRRVLIEKSPTNAGRTRWLQRHFENAYFIGIVRNGFAVAEGIRRKAGHPIGLAARQWRVSNEIMLADFEQLRHRMLIRYEDLTDDLRTQMERVGAFLELDVEKFSGMDRTWQIHGNPSSVRNMNPLSLSSLSEEEMDAVRDEAGEMLARFGYDGDSSEPSTRSN
jgi:hypothetical protein